MSTPQDRRVLVTGASRGIGRATARELAALGHPVTLHYRSSAGAAEELASEIESAGGRCSLLAFDVSDGTATRAALEADVEANGAYWGVVLSAGVTADAPFAGMADESWSQVLRTNLDSFFHVLRPLLMPMVGLRDGGRVVALSSVAGVAGNPGQVNYSASKAGLIGAVRSLGLELAKRKIAVNAVAPGFIATDMIAGLPEAELKAQVPMRRVGTPEEVAGLIAYLFGDRASYITCQTISINGGMTQA